MRKYHKWSWLSCSLSRVYALTNVSYNEQHIIRYYESICVDIARVHTHTHTYPVRTPKCSVLLVCRTKKKRDDKVVACKKTLTRAVQVWLHKCLCVHK